MKLIRNLTLSMMLITGLSACDDFELFSSGLTEEEISEGLKEALRHGVDTAVTRLGVEDGYFADEAVKIYLPEEAQPVYNALQYLPGDLVDQCVLSINRAAEDASHEATPIFVSAIQALTIEDAVDILYGEDTAATAYLRTQTRADLFNAFQPKIEASLSKVIVFNQSAESLYAKLIDLYNTASLGGLLFDPIATNSLSEHTTNKALDGLFLKVANEEVLIRTDVSHRVSEVLEEVFSELD